MNHTNGIHHSTIQFQILTINADRLAIQRQSWAMNFDNADIKLYGLTIQSDSLALPTKSRGLNLHINAFHFHNRVTKSASPLNPFAGTQPTHRQKAYAQKRRNMS